MIDESFSHMSERRRAMKLWLRLRTANHGWTACIHQAAIHQYSIHTFRTRIINIDKLQLNMQKNFSQHTLWPQLSYKGDPTKLTFLIFRTESLWLTWSRSLRWNKMRFWSPEHTQQIIKNLRFSVNGSLYCCDAPTHWTRLFQVLLSRAICPQSSLAIVIIYDSEGGLRAPFIPASTNWWYTAPTEEIKIK